MNPERISLDEARELLAKPKKKRKYRNKHVKVDGITFDSVRESEEYLALKQRLKDGEICHLKVHEPMLLLAPNGQLVGSYELDFEFFDLIEKRQRYQDVKGFDTPLSAWKRKHVKAQYGIDVEVVK